CGSAAALALLLHGIGKPRELGRELGQRDLHIDLGRFVGELRAFLGAPAIDFRGTHGNPVLPSHRQAATQQSVPISSIFAAAPPAGLARAALYPRGKMSENLRHGLEHTTSVAAVTCEQAASCMILSCAAAI